MNNRSSCRAGGLLFREGARRRTGCRLTLVVLSSFHYGVDVCEWGGIELVDCAEHMVDFFLLLLLVGRMRG